MIRTDEFIRLLNCPECNTKKLYIWASNGGEGNTEVILHCSRCGTYITSNLIPNVDDWEIDPKTKKSKKSSGRLWNQA